jgi:hypothetical protein
MKAGELVFSGGLAAGWSKINIFPELLKTVNSDCSGSLYSRQNKPEKMLGQGGT